MESRKDEFEISKYDEPIEDNNYTFVMDLYKHTRVFRF